MDVILGGICAIIGSLIGAWHTNHSNQKLELQKAAYSFIDSLAESVADLETDDFKKPIEILLPHFKSQHTMYIRFRERLTSPQKQLLKNKWVTFVYGCTNCSEYGSPFSCYSTKGRKDEICKLNDYGLKVHRL